MQCEHLHTLHQGVSASSPVISRGEGWCTDNGGRAGGDRTGGDHHCHIQAGEAVESPVTLLYMLVVIDVFVYHKNVY